MNRDELIAHLDARLTAIDAERDIQKAGARGRWPTATPQWAEIERHRDEIDAIDRAAEAKRQAVLIEGRAALEGLD